MGTRGSDTESGWLPDTSPGAISAVRQQALGTAAPWKCTENIGGQGGAASPPLHRNGEGVGRGHPALWVVRVQMRVRDPDGDLRDELLDQLAHLIGRIIEDEMPGARHDLQAALGDIAL